jgi:uncharacterized membrane protein SirB2
MIEYYSQIKFVHIVLVLVSGGVFALRGLLVLADSPLGQVAPARWISYTIDTALFTSAMMLLVMLHINPIASPWLGPKLLLLILYIALGSFALKRGRTWRVRTGCFVSALAVYVWIIGTARAHDPWSWMRWYGWM